MGFNDNIDSYYDLGNNGHLPDNFNFHELALNNWEKYIKFLVRRSPWRTGLHSFT